MLATIITLLLATLTLFLCYHWSQCCPLRTALSSAVVVAMITSVAGASPLSVPIWMSLFLAMMFWLPHLEGKRVTWQVAGLQIGAMAVN